jgi:hypothetical protein
MEPVIVEFAVCLYDRNIAVVTSEDWPKQATGDFGFGHAACRLWRQPEEVRNMFFQIDTDKRKLQEKEMFLKY